MHNNLHSSDISKKYHLRKVRVSLNKFPIFLIHNQKSDYSEKTSIFFFTYRRLFSRVVKSIQWTQTATDSLLLRAT